MSKELHEIRKILLKLCPDNLSRLKLLNQMIEHDLKSAKKRAKKMEED
jgi:hypothetical protein